MSGISVAILGQTVQADFAAVYKTRATMAAVAAAAGDIAFLAEPGREGNFIYKSNNLAAAVASDSLQGLYVPPAASPTGAAGAWVRVWDQINGYPEWFYSGDWANAIEACYKLCPVTLLGRRDYFVGRAIKLNTPWRKIVGQGGVAYDGAQGTRIVLGSGSGDVMQLGPNGNPGGNPGVTFLRGVKLDNFQLTRGASLVPAASIAASPTGLRCQYLYDCDVSIYSFESSVGAQVKSCVFSRVRVHAERSGAAITTVNDVAIGLYVDSTEDIGLAGGNASVTFSGVFGIFSTTTPAANRKGVYAYGKLADLIFDHCETVGGDTAMHLKATGSAANNVDIRILFPTLDQPTGRGILFEDFPAGSQIDVVSPYAGLPSGAVAGIDLQNCFADINVIGGQLIGASGGTTYGVRALNSRSLNLYGIGVLDFPNPIFLDGSTDCSVQPNISNPGTNGGAYAVGLSGSCARSVINPKVSGKIGAFPAAAIMLFTDSIGDIRVQTERIDTAAISGGRKLMIGATNVNIATSGRYLGNGTADASGTIVVEGLSIGDLLLSASKVLKVGGKQVVGTRQPAIADDTSGAANMAKVNAILTVLRTHGLIEP